MNGIDAPARARRAASVTLAVLVMIGIALALALAHPTERHHAVGGLITPAAHAQADHGLVTEDHDAVASALGGSTSGEELALCLTLGLGCVLALLLAILRLRRAPSSNRALVDLFVVPSPSPHITRRPESAPALTALRVSRI